MATRSWGPPNPPTFSATLGTLRLAQACANLAVSLISSAEDESSISVADHYKGTPPLKSKKKKRMSHEVPSDFQVFNSLKMSLKF